MHNGLLRLTAGEEKMTRHLGNIVTIREALARFHPDTIRVFVLSSHYRSPTTWSDEALDAAARGAERLRTARENLDALLAARPGDAAAGSSPELERASAELEGLLGAGPDATRARFEASMDDDFGGPGALAALFDLASALNRVVDAASKRRTALAGDRRELAARGVALLTELGGVLGLKLTAVVTPAQVAGLRRLARELAAERPDLFDPARVPADAADGDAGEDTAPPDAAAIAPLVELIADGRAQARRAKDWATGDRVRARLAELGVLLEDSPAGVTWRVR